MSRRATRLYRKSTGVYWLRIVLPPGVIPLRLANAKPTQSLHAEDLPLPCSHSPHTGETAAATNSTAKKHPQNRLELRRSLRTTSCKKATTLAHMINAALTSTPPSLWEQTVGQLLGDFVSSWTLHDVVTVADDDDQNRFIQFLEQKPAFEAALIDRISRDGPPTQPPTPEAKQQCATSPTEVADPTFNNGRTTLNSEPVANILGQYLPGANPHGTAGTPRNPMRLDAAAAWFQTEATELGISLRNLRDIGLTISSFTTYLCPLPTDVKPYAHHIGSNHVFGYLKAYSKRSGRSDKSPTVDALAVSPDLGDESVEQNGLAPATLLKRLSDLSTFFRLLCNEARACVDNPTEGLTNYRKALKKEAKKKTSSYWPFTADQFRTIFSPQDYLKAMRRPDTFWAPLISACTGMRLSEVICRSLAQVAQDPTGIWYFDIKDAKNDNSDRVVPLPQALIDLGFIEYVQRLQSLGARHLWPHLNLNSSIALTNPTNKHSEHFGEYLTTRGITDSRWVFHSFRHTVVCALLDDKDTSLPLSMQICGHAAQDDAVKLGLLAESAKDSVHLTTYAHPDMPRLNVESPLLEMKQALDRSIKLPLDFSGLREAAKIVTENLRIENNKFKAGWNPLKHQYQEQLLERVRRASGTTATPTPDASSKST